MILQALDALAHRENLVPDPDYEVKSVAWLIQLRPDGTLNEIIPRRTNLNEGTKKKPKWIGNPMVVPRQFYRSGTKPSAFFFADNAKFVFGRPVGNASFTEQQGLEFNERFQEQIRQFSTETKSGVADAVINFFDQLPAIRETLQLPEDAEPNDLFAFQIGLGEPIHLHPEVRAWWAARSKNSTGSASGFHCLVTGKPISGAGLYPQVANVPGAPKPVKLVSFNSDTVESHGLTKNENAPISEEAGVSSATALNRLLHSAYPDPNDPQRILPRRNIRISADTAVCFWSVQQHADDFLNGLPDLLAGENEDTVKETYRSIWRGKSTSVNDPTAFYVLVISGTQGRAVVRDWIETTLGETQRHLAKHFCDLTIVRSARLAKGKTISPVVPLNHLLGALAVEGKSENIPAPLETAFVRCAFTGQPYPFQVLQRALVRERTEAGRDDWIDAARRDARAALIKAVLQRRRRANPEASSRYPEVPVALNPQLDSEGYALGALMAVLERLQSAALGDVNATIVDRYFGAASASPRSVFVRLLRNARHHAAKAGDADDAGKRGHARRLDRMIDHFCSRFEIDRRQYPGGSNGLPMHLDLEQQGLFVLGYHQMRHWLWLPAEEKQKWEAEHPDAPSVFLSKSKEPAEAVG